MSSPVHFELDEFPEIGEHLPLDQIMSTPALITDENGIPLKSDRADELSEGIDFKYAACPFHDSPSRYPDGEPHTTPVSDLERQRLQESYPAIRRYTLATRAAYREMFFSGSRRPLTVADGVNILAFMANAPSFAVQRHIDPVEAQGVLPQHLIVGSNAAAGALAAIGAYRDMPDMEFPESKMALEVVEAIGSLVSESTVCAASPRMITNFLDLVRYGSRKIGHGNLEEETAGIIVDEQLPQAVRFGEHMERAILVKAALAGEDAAAYPFVARYSRRQGIRPIMRTTLSEFVDNVEKMAKDARRISMDTNECLDREGEDPTEFADVIGQNTFRLTTVAKAKQKGLKLKEL